MPQHSLHPTLSWIVYVCGVLAVLQWCVLIPLVIDADVLTNLNCWVGELRTDDSVCAANSVVLASSIPVTRVKALTQDLFFLEWNLLPILLTVAHFAISTFHRANQDTFRARFRNFQGETTPLMAARVRDNLPLVFGLLIVLNFVAISAQLSKQAQFEAEASYLYFWDERISPAIYYVRLAFLAPVITLVALVLWEAMWGLWTVFRLVRTSRIAPQILDPDKRFGLQPYGIYSMLMIVPGFLALITAALQLSDHHGEQGIANNVGSISIGLVGIAALYLILEPMVRLHLELERSRRRVLEAVERETFELEAYLAAVAQGVAADSKTITNTSSAYLLHQHVVTSSSWPFPSWFGPPTFVALISPFLGAFGISLTTLVQMLIQFIRGSP